MSLIFRTAVLFLAAIVVVAHVAPVAAAQQTTRDLSDPAELESFVDGAMASHMESHNVPGATVAVVKDGDLFFTKGYGYADVENRTPVRANRTLFRVGSVSKLVTTTAVMQGVESGQLALDADVNTYLDNSSVRVQATYDDPVTLEHLGTHTAGFEDVYEGVFHYNQSDMHSLETGLADSQPARVRPPGELAAYSNWGMALAGHVVAEQAGTSFDEYVAANVFDPLEMEHTTFRQPVPAALENDLAIGYRYRNGAFEAGQFEYVGIPPAGSMSATATDMGRFMLAHLGEGTYDGARILNAATVETMHERHFAHDPRVNGMAYGFIEQDRNGQRIIGHGGATELFHSQLVLLPEHEIGLFVSYNAPGGALAGPAFVDAFLDRYFPGDEDAQSEAGAPSSGAAERATEVAGEYRSTRVPYTSWWKFAGLTQSMTVQTTPGSELVVTPTGGGETTRWVEIEPFVYREVGGDENETLIFDEAGDGMRLFLSSNPTAAYQQLAWYETSDTTLIAFIGSLLLFLMAAVLWAVLAVYRWRIGRPPWSRRTWGSRGVVALLGGLLSVFLAGLAVAATDPITVLAGESALVTGLLAVPYVVVPLALAIVGFTVFAWRDREWSVVTRLHYTLLAAAALVVVWQLSYWQFLAV